MELGRVAPLTSTLTNCPGRREPLGLLTTERTRKVPVSLLKEGSAKLIRPLLGNIDPSASTTSTENSLLGGNLSRPAARSLRYFSSSFSEMLKLTHMGSICAT